MSELDAAALHRDAVVIDGLVISRWSRDVFEAMHRGGLSAANCTCSVWEGFRDTMVNITQWQRWCRDNDDILRLVHGTADILEAKREGRVGIILGWQNTSALEDRVEFVELFKRLGVGVMQLTYNTQNLVGSGCWESQDAGLSDFGREVVHEMNRVGVLIDLSHVGAATSRETVLHSNKPVAYTHCCPTGLKDYPRNKTDEELKLIADRGGFIGVATYPPFLPWGDDTTVDHCVEVFDYMINLVGEDAVGIGTDFTQDQDVEFFRWLRSDKGHGRTLVPGQVRVPQLPKGFGALDEYPSLTEAFVRHGWAESRIRKVLGENWLRMLGEAWNE
jgi:membrane dipeptidase